MSKPTFFNIVDIDGKAPADEFQKLQQEVKFEFASHTMKAVSSWTELKHGIPTPMKNPGYNTLIASGRK